MQAVGHQRFTQTPREKKNICKCTVHKQTLNQMKKKVIIEDNQIICLTHRR